MMWTNAQLILARPMQIVEILKEALSAVAKVVSVVMAFSAQMMTNAPTEQVDVMKMLPVSTTVVLLPAHVIPATMTNAVTVTAVILALIARIQLVPITASAGLDCILLDLIHQDSDSE